MLMVHVGVKNEGIRELWRPFTRSRCAEFAGTPSRADGRVGTPPGEIHTFIDLSGNCTLVVHLGMSGCFVFRHCGDPIDAHDHAILDLDNGVSVRFNDRRRFGFIALIAADAEADLQCLARLGPEPFETRFNEEYLAARLKGRPHESPHF